MVHTSPWLPKYIEHIPDKYVHNLDSMTRLTCKKTKKIFNRAAIYECLLYVENDASRAQDRVSRSPQERQPEPSE
jgi:ribosomal protein S17E